MSGSVLRKQRPGTAFRVVLGLSFLFYLWYACQLPYTHDDWEWGLAAGMRHLLTADVNSRYAGNLVEVLVTRSALLKNLVIALVMTGIPLSSLCLVLRFCEGERQRLAPLLLAAANLLQLCTIRLIWQETYGWIAGFSNFAVSAPLVNVFHLLLADAFLRRERPKGWRLPARFLFGLSLQLFLENIAVYALLLMLACLAVKALRRLRVTGGDWALLLGLASGTALMFSSGIYATLLHTGSAVGGYRQLTFSLSDGPLSIAFSLLKRFLILFPPSLWAASTVPVCAALLGLAALLLQSGRRGGWPLAALNAALALYVLFVCFFGEFGRLRLASSWWSNALSALMGLVIGLVVVLEIVLLWRTEAKTLCFALFCWLSRPALMLPMAAITNADPRCFLTTDVMLAPFVLLVLSRLWLTLPSARRRPASLVAGVLLCAALLHVLLPFAAIGRLSRQRDALIRAAREHPGETLLLPAYPEALQELLWKPDPLSPESAYTDYFRAFYRIPPDTPLRFESWEQS